VSSDGTVVQKGVTKERWEQVKSKTRWISNEIGLRDEFTPVMFGDLANASNEDGGTPEGKLHFKTTESCVGFLVYVAMTYTSMVPYLKDIYLSLNSWRQGRDEYSWADQKRKQESLQGNTQPDGNAPKWVDMTLYRI